MTIDQKKKEEVKILIVDDDAANILLLQKILKLQGYKNISSLVDPKKVIALHNENDFDLILLDINMPEMNGYDVLKQLYDENSVSIPFVIGISGDATLSDINKAKQAGFSEYITKPIKMKTLLQTIERLLSV